MDTLNHRDIFIEPPRDNDVYIDTPGDHVNIVMDERVQEVYVSVDMDTLSVELQAVGMTGPKGDTGAQGPQGQSGGQGAQGTNDSYTFVQSIPSDCWDVYHNLHRYPTVAVKDDDNNEIFCEISHLSTDHLQVLSVTLMTGTAYCT